MKIVVTSDWHLDAVTAGVERFADVDESANRVVKRAIEQGADLFLFLGDLCDPDAARAPRCVARAIAYATELAAHGIPSRWIVGNHDVIEDGSATSTLTPLAAVGESRSDSLIRVVSKAEREVIGGVQFLWLPFPARGLSYDPAAFVEQTDVEAGPVVVGGHLTVPGIDPGSETHDMPRGRDVNFPVDEVRARFGSKALMLNGHYHRWRTDTDFVVVPGSLERLTFGEEAHTPGWLNIEASATVKRGKSLFHVEVVKNPNARALATVDYDGSNEVPEAAKPWTLMRVRPAAGVDVARYGAFVDQLRGACAAVRALPAQTISAPVVAKGAATAPCRKRARDVVEELAANAVGVDKTNLAEFLREIMDGEGL